MDGLTKKTSLKVKIITSILLGIAILSALFVSGLAVEAGSAPIEITSNDAGASPDRCWFCFNDDLVPKWYLLCSQRDKHIPDGDDGQVNGTYNGGTSFTINCKNTIYDNGQKLLYHWTNSSSNSFDKTEYNRGVTTDANGNTTAKSYESDGYYTKTGTYISSPMESYIMAEAELGNTGSYYSYVQEAWWRTWAGHRLGRWRRRINECFK